MILKNHLHCRRISENIFVIQPLEYALNPGPWMNFEKAGTKRVHRRLPGERSAYFHEEALLVAVTTSANA